MPSATRFTTRSGTAKQRRRIGVGVAALVLSLFLAVALVPRAAGAPRVAPPSACPSSALKKVAANGWVQARTELAPYGPSALRLCRYLGDDSSLPGALARSRLLEQPALLASLVDRLDGLPPLPHEIFGCTLDDGSQILALLAYPGGERVTVSIDPTGCVSVTNGDLVRTASGYHDTPEAQALIAELLRLTAPESGDAGVAGQVRLCGGPAPTRCFAENATVAVLDAAGEVVAIEGTTHARFSFSLPPGAYTLEAISGMARGRRRIALAAGRTKRVNVVVPIP